MVLHAIRNAEIQIILRSNNGNHSNQNIVESQSNFPRAEPRVGLHVKYPLLLSDFI
jgi:hypothetical protein